MEANLVQLSAFLKEGTRETHNQAESSDFQSRLANAELSLDKYGAYLGQLYLVHQLLEKGLAEDPICSKVAKETQFQTEFLRRDLVALGVNPSEIQPLPPTSEILYRIEQGTRSNPMSLIGHHYVLFGSKHGGKYIAAQIRKKFSFDADGSLYFDPYGANFQPQWVEFRTAMDNLETSEPVAQTILQAAREMFSYVGALGYELSNEPSPLPDEAEVDSV